MAAQTRDTYYQQILGKNVHDKIKKARVLMVGAGGIGCELLKNLVLSNFGTIHIVDLDTIDLSNLNRQFLFRQEHIKKSKALVAKEVASKFNTQVEIVAHHANIKDAQFGVEWFRSFDMVFNALDNLDARRHVNKMCLAADIVLIESGTTGFNGQVQVIKKGYTACYDCTPKDTPKTFPVCTIRSTPSQPVHCIVWGKSYLLNEIFGTSEDESAFDHSADAENAKEIEELKKEAAALRKIRNSVGTSVFPKMLFEKVFDSDIRRLLSMEDMWKSRKPPEPLKYDELMGRASEALASKEALLQDGQKVWTAEESLVVFNDSLERLSKTVLEMRRAGEDSVITFDKDDPDTLDFVAASANLRSTIFGIERRSRFDMKQMAGNIIPAIATTNAIVAGLCALQAYKIFEAGYVGLKEVFLTPFNDARLLASDTSRLPNPTCSVCSAYQTSAYVDLETATLNDIIEDFVKLGLGFGDKEFSLSNEVGTLYDPDETENISKKLGDLGIKQDSFLTVIDEDDDDNAFVNVVINIQEFKEKGEKPVQTIEADKRPAIPRRPKKAAQPQENGEAATETPTATLAEAGKKLKRPRPDEEADGGSANPAVMKKTKTAQPTSDDVVIVEDESGAIVID